MLGKHINPAVKSFIGETYQCTIDGAAFYSEQCNHEANALEGVICEYYTGDGFVMTGYKSGILNAGPTQAIYDPTGVQTLTLKESGHVLKWTIPSVMVKNPLGERHYYCQSFMYMWSKKLGILARMHFAPDQGGFMKARKLPLDTIQGVCYQV